MPAHRQLVRENYLLEPGQTKDLGEFRLARVSVEYVGKLLEEAKSDQARARMEAARELGRLATEMEHLLPEAAASLRGEGLRALVRALKDDEHWEARCAAATSLSQLGEPAAVAALKGALSDEHGDVRRNALGALRSPALSAADPDSAADLEILSDLSQGLDRDMRSPEAAAAILRIQQATSDPPATQPAGGR